MCVCVLVALQVSGHAGSYREQQLGSCETAGVMSALILSEEAVLTFGCGVRSVQDGWCAAGPVSSVNTNTMLLHLPHNRASLSGSN